MFLAKHRAPPVQVKPEERADKSKDVSGLAPVLEAIPEQIEKPQVQSIQPEKKIIQVKPEALPKEDKSELLQQAKINPEGPKVRAQPVKRFQKLPGKRRIDLDLWSDGKADLLPAITFTGQGLRFEGTKTEFNHLIKILGQ